MKIIIKGTKKILREGDGWVDPFAGNPDAQKRYYLQLGAEGQRQFKEEHPDYPYDEWDAESKRVALEGHMGSEGTGLSDIPHGVKKSDEEYEEQRLKLAAMDSEIRKREKQSAPPTSEDPESDATDGGMRGFFQRRAKARDKKLKKQMDKTDKKFNKSIGIGEAVDWKGDSIGYKPTHSKPSGVDDAYPGIEKAKKKQRDYDKELWDKLSQQDQESAEESILDGDEVGQFITDHDGAEAALAYIEAMRQEIIELMDEEEKEIQFAQDNPEYAGGNIKSGLEEQGVAQAAGGAAGGGAGKALGGAVAGPAGAVVGGLIGAKAGEKIAQKVAEKPKDPLEPKNKDVTKALEYIGDKAGMYLKKINTRSKKKEFLYGILDFLDMQAADMMTGVKASVKDQKTEKDASMKEQAGKNTMKESKVLIKVRKNKCL